jgi:multidrug resistance efflux pump
MIRRITDVLGATPWAEAKELLPSGALVPSTAQPRRVARNICIVMVLFAIAAVLTPWQQNIAGSGRVVAFAPDERPQPVQSTIDGRIGKWHVLEGTHVEEGQLLVSLVDNDPDRIQRITVQRDAALSRLEAYQDQVKAYEERLTALEESQRAQISAAEAEIRVARQSVASRQQSLRAKEAELEAATLQLNRVRDLTEDGLSSQRDFEVATLNQRSAQAGVESARADLQASKNGLETKQAGLERVKATTEADLRSARAALRSADTKVEETRSSIASYESRLAQQEAQEVRAPRDGTIQKIFAQQGGMQVSQGQTLARLVPTTTSRAVELLVDGNNAALITEGRHVRLQFEGWPALQFSGWPSVAVGTFGGTVAFVDPADDGKGRFRVVIIPDENDDEDWPDVRFLRQGTRAKGWVLLEEVALGFELWRQLNGFPPALDEQPGGKEDKETFARKDKK